ncbi:MAG: ABC transporter substrate-binding protein, partial [Proteobacteria bacterium]|nr:ABC transporter substrate-binding protein [Pseudomonadota bacterium]
HSEPEALMTLKPDLVIAASFNSLPLLDLVKQKKIPILVLSQFANHGDIQKNILDIGKMIDCPDKAKKMAEAFSQRIRKVKDESKSYPVETAVLYSQDLMVMAGETLFDDFLTMNHLANAATKAGLKYWPVISAEALKEWNPDWLVIICEPEICPQKAKVLKEQPAWKNLQATRKNNFLFISSKELMSTSQYFGALLKRPAPRP